MANSAGKGRDDLTLDILIAAENISRTVSNYQSRAIRKLAERIRQAFLNIRLLFRKYSENIEFVDPQLKNNTDLSEALLAYEKSWEKGKEFLLNQNIRSILISFSQQVESLTEKHIELQEKIDSMDADLFMIIPCIIILRTLDENDRRIYNLYYPELRQQNGEQENFDKLKKDYNTIKSKNDGFDVYNLLENAILEKDTDLIQLQAMKITKEDIDKFVNEIKRLAILLQRSKPTDWNTLMETAMGII